MYFLNENKKIIIILIILNLKILDKDMDVLLIKKKYFFGVF